MYATATPLPSQSPGLARPELDLSWWAPVEPTREPTTLNLMLDTHNLTYTLPSLLENL